MFRPLLAAGWKVGGKQPHDQRAVTRSTAQQWPDTWTQAQHAAVGEGRSTPAPPHPVTVDSEPDPSTDPDAPAATPGDQTPTSCPHSQPPPHPVPASVPASVPAPVPVLTPTPAPVLVFVLVVVSRLLNAPSTAGAVNSLTQVVSAASRRSLSCRHATPTRRNCSSAASTRCCALHRTASSNPADASSKACRAATMIWRASRSRCRNTRASCPIWATTTPYCPNAAAPAA